MDAYRVAFNTWQEKTEWVQKDKRFDVLLPWGKHRADVLKEYIEHLEARCAALAAELSALQGKPIAWESTTPVYVKFITDERYQRLRPGYKKWYKPYRCSQCAVAGKGEVS